MSSNSGGVNTGYRYDEANRLAFVDDASGVQPVSTPTRTTSYTYNANGSLQTAAAANGVTHTYQYDTLNRLRTLNVSTLPSQILGSYTYALNPSGHRHQITEGTGRTVTYTYDALYRLTSETISGTGVSPVGSLAYTLDKVGNRESRTSSVSSVAASSNSYNSRDWLSGDTYDTNGNTKTTPLTALGAPLTIPDVYDFEDRLIVRTRSDGMTINLNYDADGIRLEKSIFDVSASLVSATGYFVDTNNLTGYAQVVEEYVNTSSGTKASVYTYGSSLISQSVSLNGQLSTLNYFGFDGLGSVRFLTNGAGTVTDSYDYDAFGVLIRRTGTTTNNYLYRGEQYDPDLGMYSLRARFYNQSTGRFWNQDSYEGSSGDPASLHKYLYANADPVMGRDPSGNFSLIELMQAADAVGILSTIALPTIQAAASASLPYLAALGVASSTANLMRMLYDDDFRAYRTTTVLGAAETTLDATGLAGGYAALLQSVNLVKGAINAGRAAVQIVSTTTPIFETGVNITPELTAMKYTTLGSGGRTFVTTVDALVPVTGPLDAGRIIISGAEARVLEKTLGLAPFALQESNVISIVDTIKARAPASPIAGNAFFLGGGAGLPGGQPELTISGIASQGGPGVTQIILRVEN